MHCLLLKIIRHKNEKRKKINFPQNFLKGNSHLFAHWVSSVFLHHTHEKLQSLINEYLVTGQKLEVRLTSVEVEDLWNYASFPFCYYTN